MIPFPFNKFPMFMGRLDGIAGCGIFGSAANNTDFWVNNGAQRERANTTKRSRTKHIYSICVCFVAKHSIER